jgi:hypothetical protein
MATKKAEKVAPIKAKKTLAEATPQEKIAEITQDVAIVTRESKKLVKIVTEDEAKKASTFLAGVKTRLNRIEEVRVFYTKPLVEQQRNLNALFKQQSDPLTAVFNLVNGAVKDYLREQERIARAQEEKLRIEQEKKNAKLEAKGKTPDFTPAPTVERAPTGFSSGMGGGVSAQKVWTHKIIDEALVPRQYLIVNEQAIKDAVKSGTRSIAGVDIYEDFKTQVRSNG